MSAPSGASSRDIDLDRLATALARLLAAWWRQRTEHVDEAVRNTAAKEAE